MNILVDLAYECLIQVTRLFNLRRRNALFVGMAGRAGSGKGNIGTKLAEKYKIPLLSTGNLLRAEVDAKTDIGLEWGPVMKAGKLVPDWVIFHLLSRELAKPEYDKGAILDGFPRTLPQAKMLRRMLAWRGNKLDVVIYLDVDRQDLIERLTGRRTCSNSKCNSPSYHIKYRPSKVEGICDVCGSPTKQRDDETPEAIEERFKEFDIMFAPLHRYYEDNRLLVTIHSTNAQGIDAVFESVVFAVEEVD